MESAKVMQEYLKNHGYFNKDGRCLVGLGSVLLTYRLPLYIDVNYGCVVHDS